MLFHQNMILDATRGSVARFVNRKSQSLCLHYYTKSLNVY